MSSPAEKLSRRMTLEEYYEFQERSETKYEFHDGEVLAMSGGTVEHGSVGANLSGMLYSRIRGTGCRHTTSDTAVYIKATNRSVFPDATVVCGKRELHVINGKNRAILNPLIVFECLSDSTVNYDRGEKLDQYKLIPTFREYVLLSQHEARVERCVLQPDGELSMRSFVGLEAVAKLSSVDIEMPLGELYDGVLTP